MKHLLLINLIAISLFSCSSTNIVLKKYYYGNKDLHHALADSLNEFVKQHKTEVIMRKRLDGGNQIYFSYHFEKDNISVPIEFDNKLYRVDPMPEYTSKIIVPIEIIKLFKKSIYTALIADSTEVFFGYKDSFDGNSKYGIVIDRDTADNSKRHIQKLAKNVYITKGIIP